MQAYATAKESSLVIFSTVEEGTCSHFMPWTHTYQGDMCKNLINVSFVIENN